MTEIAGVGEAENRASLLLEGRKLECVGGQWWTTYGQESELVEKWKYRIALKSTNGKVFMAWVRPSVLVALAVWGMPKLSIERLGDLRRHEQYERENFARVKTDPWWNDLPLLVVEGDRGDEFIGDGATRTGRLLEEIGEDAWVVVQRIGVSNLTLGTWLDPSKRLTMEKVFEKVNKGELVEPKQTRFGGIIKLPNLKFSIAVSVAEMMPVVRVEEQLF